MTKVCFDTLNPCALPPTYKKQFPVNNPHPGGSRAREGARLWSTQLL